MRSRAAPETSTFDRWLGTVAEATRGRELTRSLDVVAELAAERFDARLRFVKIIGRRWSHIAGYYSQTPAASGMEHIPLGGNVGLVSDCWGTLAGSARARLLDFLCEMVSLGRQT